ncbi:MAG: hypothetical protein NC819_04110 [Candidatus Omnitrophica bacterium]|nr:hypothetical protein [Candidatus Omnitrophota bacterium]
MKRGLLLGSALLAAVGAAGAAPYVEERARIRLQADLSDLFRVPVRIGAVSFSPRHLTLSDIRPEALEPQKNAPVFGIDELQIKGNLLSVLWHPSFLSWSRKGEMESFQISRMTLLVAGIPLQAKGELFLTRRTNEAALCEGWLDLAHPLLKGRLEVSGPVDRPILFGWVSFADKEPVHFVSRWALNSREIRCEQMETGGGWLSRGVITAAGGKAGSEGFDGSVDVWRRGEEERYELQLFSVSPSGGDVGFWVHRPAQMPQDLIASWTIEGSRVKVKASGLRESVLLDGSVGLAAPFPVDLTLDLRAFPLAESIRWIPNGDQQPLIGGRLLGTVQVRGSLGNLASKGEVSGVSMLFGTVAFPRVALRFDGNGPILRIRDSQLVRESGVLLMEGVVDMRRIGQPDFFRGVKLSSLDKSLRWGEWRVSDIPGVSGLELHKYSKAGNVSVGLNYQVDTQNQPESVQREGVKVGLPLSPQEKLKIQMEGEEGFLGVEHRKKF